MDRVAGILSYRPHVYLLVFLLVLSSAGRFAEVDRDTLAAALGFAALMAFVYLFNKWTDFAEDAVNAKSGALDPAGRRRALYAALFFLLLPLVFLHHNRYLLLLYAFVAVNGFLYSYRIKVFGRSFRCKDVFILKNATSAVSWAAPPALVPAALYGEVWLVDIASFAVTFCIVFAIEIVWDVRDMAGDRSVGIRTIPNAWGIPWARAIGSALLALPAYWMVHFAFLPSALAGLAVSAALVLAVDERRGLLFYHSLIFVWCAAMLVRLAFGV